ncbi:hypothetical protein BZA05DRAFT_116315 [Tricharina praecox]|uniref:uncharacterized protein n=1 Tax=Tricharina praecox TaxID=43433 RepID=UPI00221F3A07|nr:uncharacterized protein BZA05DRAFT_116315 [Tricharina praecox]KAI5858129.1 hypothetical protein BZA05DRAFT_116315 [Tricharina praecox]
MLEDPTHSNVVRWSHSGDSFIVVDTNDFTKNILPQHFKHSNFASFVRQLNKYDFHKIKNTDEGAGSGEGWQFKHPEFTKDSKDNLDNIRRKAPASRKQQTQFDESGSQQIEQLQGEFRQVRESQQVLNERMQKFHEQTGNAYQDMQLAISSQAVYIHQHEEIIKRLLSVLSDLSAQVRSLKQDYGRNNSHGQEILHDDPVSPGQTGGMGSSATSPANHQQAPGSNGSPLQQAQRLMEGYRNLQRPSIQAGIDQFPMAHQDQHDGGYGGGYQNGQMMNVVNGTEQSGEHMFPGINHPFNNNGHPPGQLPWQHPHQETPPPPQGSSGSVVGGNSGRPTPNRKRSTPQTPHWRSPPRVLLVEDDPTCRRIGSKFLTSAQCMVDVADDGLIAVNKMGRKTYDLVLMDIMMPNLDGCSAAALIRQFNTDTPIIAMTSNIRRDDINNYFNNGMNDVLPKPFTKEGLLQMLEHQLVHLTRPKGGQQPQQQPQQQQPSHGQMSQGSIPTQLNFNNPQHGMHHDQLADPPNTGNGLKYSVSPAPSKSPGTAGMYSTGRSPTDMAEDVPQQVQPQGGMEEPGGGYMGMMGGYMPDDASAHGHSYQSPAQGQRRLAEDDMYGPIKKQQRY